MKKGDYVEFERNDGTSAMGILYKNDYPGYWDILVDGEHKDYTQTEDKITPIINLLDGTANLDWFARSQKKIRQLRKDCDSEYEKRRCC